MHKKAEWLRLTELSLLTTLLFVLTVPSTEDGLEQGFHHPPREARPHVYWLWLNGFVGRAGAA